MYIETAKWLVNRIRELEERAASWKASGRTGEAQWWPTHRVIWQGSYDVWNSEQDRIDAIEIPKAVMRAALDEGIVSIELRVSRGRDYNVFVVTEIGEQYLRDRYE